MIDAERWPHVRSLFERVVEEKPDDVPAWLDREGVDDWQLREELLSLVRHHESAGSFLAEAAGDRLPQFMGENAALQPGQVLGPYTIVRELGGGGQGRVYLARDERLGRMVALKALAPELTADPSHRERLRREARAAAAITHPGICTIHALEEFDGELYIASEFITGHTLREEVKGPRPPAHEVVRLARELASALGRAHEGGITHRDLKPENVMRTEDGRLKIVDFGLARLETPADERDVQMTRQGAFMGTPAYMSPEQLRGERADARTDVWALGVLIYEYACGAHPFDAPTTMARVGRILEDQMDPIESCRHDLPIAIVDVVERSLSKAPADRFASAGEMVRALDRRDTKTGRMTVWWRTHQLTLIALYFIACGLTWQIKEWQPGFATALFLFVGVAAAAAGVLRGHLLFTERVNAPRITAEHARILPFLLAADLLLALALAIDGMLLGSTRPVPGVLTIALGVCIALARLVVEPSTTSASFK